MATRKPKIKSIASNMTPSEPKSKFAGAGQSLWKLITDEFDISDAGGIALLEQICHAQDRVEQLAAQIAIDGAIIYVKGVPKAHPALRDELANRAFITRNLQRLGVNVEAIKSPGRPPGYSPPTR
jgi:hypothetical protein